MIQAVLAILMFCAISLGYLFAFSALIAFWPIPLFFIIVLRKEIVKWWKNNRQIRKEWEAANPGLCCTYNFEKGKLGYFNSVTKKWSNNVIPPDYEGIMVQLEKEEGEIRKQRRKDQQAYSEMCKQRRKEQYASNL